MVFTHTEYPYGLLGFFSSWNLLLQRLRTGDDDETFVVHQALNQFKVFAEHSRIFFHRLEKPDSIFPIFGGERLHRFVEAFHFADIGRHPEDIVFQGLENGEGEQSLHTNRRTDQRRGSRHNAFKHRLVYMKGAASIQINCHGWNCSG